MPECGPAGVVERECERSRRAVRHAAELCRRSEGLLRRVQSARAALVTRRRVAQQTVADLRGGRVAPALEATDILATPAQERLFTSHRWLAYRLARRFAERGEPLEDLHQVALLALAKAAARFDGGREVKFSTYAGKVIIGELKRHFRDHAWAVKLPRSVHDRYHQAKSGNEFLRHELGRSPTPAELADHMGIPEEEVIEALAAVNGYRALSIDAPASSHSPDLRLELPTTDVEVERFECGELLSDLLDRLSEEDRRIVELYFGESRSQAEVGAALGLSQVNVSRRIARILARLRALARG